MKKHEYMEAVKQFAKKAKRRTWQTEQDKMIDAYVRNEIKRVRESFNDFEDVGSFEQLEETAINYQKCWRYEKNSLIDPIF